MVCVDRQRRVRVRWCVTECGDKNGRRAFVKSLVDRGSRRLLVLLISEKVFQHARDQICAVDQSADRSLKSGPWCVQVRSVPLLSRPRNPGVSSLTAAAQKIVVSNRPNNVAQKRKDMNVNDVWWIFLKTLFMLTGIFSAQESHALDLTSCNWNRVFEA